MERVYSGWFWHCFIGMGHCKRCHQPVNDQRVMDQSNVTSLAVKRLVDAGYFMFCCQIVFLFIFMSLLLYKA